MVKRSNLLKISWELNEARLAEACGNWAHHMKLSCLEISMGIQDDAHRRFRLIVRVQLTSKFGKLCDHVETRQAECRRLAGRPSPSSRPRATTRLFRPDNYSVPSSPVDRSNSAMDYSCYGTEPGLLSRAFPSFHSRLSSPHHHNTRDPFPDSIYTSKSKQ